MLLLVLLALASCDEPEYDINHADRTFTGYEKVTHDASKTVTVHVVPHTHDDVGWLKTVDQYYYGSRDDIYKGGVQYIIDTVIGELVKDPSKTFIYVEIAFFKRWWEEQDEKMKKVVRELVQNKQLEFINAGYCMNDEASVHYTATVDQMSEGLRWLARNVGTFARPRIAWQIDPFGHSSAQASLSAQMGLEGMFFARMHYQDYDKRKKEQNLEYNWLASGHSIFTGVLYRHYNAPPGFCFDRRCTDPPMVDNQASPEYNIQSRIRDFLKYLDEQASHYRSGNIMLTMGGDFCYQNALKYFKNLDILMKYVNLNTTNNGYKMIYSTPSRYMDAVLSSIGPMQTKTDDLFPYADRKHSYWTGYFTSRPALKGYVRECNRVLQTCKQVEAMVGVSSGATSNTLALAMGVSQHHDAVSGTSKQHVADDYARRLAAGQTECEVVMSEAFSDLTKTDVKFEHCRLRNESVCEATNQAYNQSFTLLVYNPLSQTLHTTIRVPLQTAKYQLMSSAGLMYTEFIPTSVQTWSLNKDAAPVEGLFNVKLPPLGYQTLHLVPLPNLSTPPILRPAPVTMDQITVENKYYVLTFDPITGSMISIMNKLDGVTDNISQRFLQYTSSTGTKDDHQASGAYIFRPKVQAAEDLGTPTLTIHYPGELVTELWQTFGQWLSQVTRVYRDTPYIEVEWTVGPIPLDHGREIITRYTTSLETNGTFYTDSNGREMLPRILNYQPTWEYDTSAEPVAANYYPVNSRAALKDLEKGSQLTVLVDRSQGGASLSNGELELMLHRRCLKDDSRGVAEALNETAFGEGLVVRGKHWLVYSGLEMADYLHRSIGQELLLQPSLAVAQGVLPGGYQQYTALASDLPKFVNLMTWRAMPEDSKVHLIRLENMLAASEGGGPTDLDLSNIFKHKELKAFEEVALGADRPISSLVPNLQKRFVSDGTVITLEPFQIRTFYLMFQ